MDLDFELQLSTLKFIDFFRFGLSSYTNAEAKDFKSFVIVSNFCGYPPGTSLVNEVNCGVWQSSRCEITMSQSCCRNQLKSNVSAWHKSGSEERHTAPSKIRTPWCTSYLSLIPRNMLMVSETLGSVTNTWANLGTDGQIIDSVYKNVILHIPSFESRIRLDILPVLGERRCPNTSKLATSKKRFEQISSVLAQYQPNQSHVKYSRTPFPYHASSFRSPSGHDQMQLVDEQNHTGTAIFGSFLDFVEDRLYSLLVLPLVLRACT